MRRQVGQDVADSYVTMASIWLQLTQARLALDSSSEALEIARKRFEAGLADAVEVLNVQNVYISAAGNMTNLRAAYWIAQAKWRWAISDEEGVEIPETVRMDSDLPPFPDPSRENPSGEGNPAPEKGAP